MANDHNLTKKGKGFQKGVVYNPLGGGAHNQDIKKLKKLTAPEIAEVGSMILEGNLDKLKAVLDDPNASVLKLWFSSIATKAIEKGDASSFSIILDRIVGKPKEKIEIEAMLETKNLTEDEKMSALKELVNFISDKR